MNVSLLQPRIIRGNIKHNLKVVQRLVNEGRGDLLVLPEYVLTGSLTLDLEANVHDWTREAADAKARINLPDGKYLLINSLIEIDSTLRNCCELLPTEEFSSNCSQMRMNRILVFFQEQSRRFLSYLKSVSR